MGKNNIIKMFEDLSDLVGRAEILMEDMLRYLPDSKEGKRLNKSYKEWLEKLDRATEKD